MDLIDSLNSIATRIPTQKDHLQTEEATKNALVMPFIQALGYDVFNLSEVVPEFTADIGTKKGEKVDYTIIQDGDPVILIECKTYGTNLEKVHASQLYRYYNSVSSAKIGILTDGAKYHFYTDLEEMNKMDEKPFMKLDLENIQEHLIPELKKIAKSTFNLEKALNAATELKYTKAIVEILSEEMSDPSEEFVKFFTHQVYSGRVTQTIKDQFKPIVKRSFKQFIEDKLEERFNKVREFDDVEETEEVTEEISDEEDDNDSRIETTEEELEGYYIVRGIVSEVVSPDRVAHRDTISYMGILLDDNNRQPICRLRFNRSQKYIGIIDEEKNEEKMPIEKLTDIYKFSESLKKTAQSY